MIQKSQKIYTLTYTIISCTNGNNKNLYIDFEAVIQLKIRIKTANYVKTQAISYINSKYISKKYLKTDRFNSYTL